MSAFDFFELMSIMTPRMLTLGAIYPLQATIRTVRATNPDLKGPAFWGTVLNKMNEPAQPQLPAYEHFDTLGAVQDWAASDERLLFHGKERSLSIQPLAPNLALIRALPGDAFPEPFSYSVVNPPAAFDVPPLALKETDEHLNVQLDRLTLQIARDSGQITLIDPEGWALFQGRGIGWHAEGQLSWQAQFDRDNAFYGLGEKASELNYAGKRFELWNIDPAAYERGHDPLYMSIPFLFALHDGQAVGLFFDNPHRSWVNIGADEPGAVEYRVLDDEFRLYVMVGSPAEVLETYTAITGRMELPPLWALGFHQSRWSYYPQERVLEVARTFREKNIPCDVIHLDIHYMDDYRCFTWDRNRFPDPPGMIEDLHAMGFRALSMIDPGIKVDRGYHVYDQGIENGHFMTYPDGVPFTGPVWPGNCHFPDFTNPETRAWWGDLYQPLLDDGMDAFWNDMNEIALITHATRGTWVPDIVAHDKEGEGATHAEIHNVYGMLMARASQQGLRKHRPERRPLILTRSGWAGVQRFAIHWTGDNKSTWDHLRLSIPMVLNLGMSGVAFTGPDLGGFSGGPSPELYARWMQVGVFTPFMRAHSMISSPDHEPWAFGSEVESINRRYLNLRYRLLPYLYTAVWQAAQTGRPIMRAMAFEFPDDATTYSMDNQYMFGDAFLVSPVLEEGVEKKCVYLPEGTWFDFWTGEQYEGEPTFKLVQAPLDTLPLFVRGGAMIPLWPVQQYVGEKQIDELTLRAYAAPGKHTSTLYEDDGLTPAYDAPENHCVSSLTLTASDDLRTLSIRRVIEAGSYNPGYQQVTLKIYGLPAEPGSVALVGGDVTAQTWVPESSLLTVEIAAVGAFELKLG